MKVSWINYLITACFGVLVFFAVIIVEGIFGMDSTKAVLGSIMDGFFVSGVLTAGVGLLTWSGNNGTFDMLTFGVKQAVRIFNPIKKLGPSETFFDYTQKKHEKKAPYGFLLLVGAIELILAVVFLIIYLSI